VAVSFLLPSSLYGASEHVEQFWSVADCRCSGCAAADDRVVFADRPVDRLVLSDDDLGRFGRRGDANARSGDHSGADALRARAEGRSALVDSRTGLRWAGSVRVAPNFGDRYERAFGAASGPSAAVTWGDSATDAPLSSRLLRAWAAAAPSLCAHCGEAFVARRSTARFCSAACRLSAHRAEG
jgi:hypothetical protein